MTMKKEDLIALAHLITIMKDSLDELEKAQKMKDNQRVIESKKEILNIQKKIDELL